MKSWTIVISFLCVFGRTIFCENTGASSSSCSQIDCLRCDLNTSQCVRCQHVLVTQTRECHSRCPKGFVATWSADSNIYGKVCQERFMLSMVSYREVGVIAGASIVGILSIGILIFIYVLRNRDIKRPPDSPPVRGLPKSIQDKRPKTAEISIKGKDRDEFISRLRALRADAPIIFRMMAGTRNRYKVSTALGPDTPSDTKSKACKAIVRDLSRVLCLLSLKEEHLKTAPKDWKPLLLWAERLLIRYKRTQGYKENQHQALSTDSEIPQNTVTISKETRTLYVTRQQQIQADKEKRRWETEKNIPEETRKNKDNLYFNLHCNQNLFEAGVKDASVNMFESLPETKQPLQKSNQKQDNLTITFNSQNPSLYKKNSTADFHSQSFDHKIPSLSRFDNIVEFLLGLKQMLISKLKRHTKIQRNQDIESTDTVDSKSRKASKSIFSSGDDDDIASQVFFDHIEAFTFDATETPAVKDYPESSIDEKSLKDSNKYTKVKHNIQNDNMIPKKDIKNKIYLEKSCKNLQNSVRKYNTKESKPGRLKRLSNSFLLNSKPKIKTRRPLKRQKQVEKSSRFKIINKYRSSSLADQKTNRLPGHVEIHEESISDTSSTSSEEQNYQKTPKFNIKPSFIEYKQISTYDFSGQKYHQYNRISNSDSSGQNSPTACHNTDSNGQNSQTACPSSDFSESIYPNTCQSPEFSDIEVIHLYDSSAQNKKADELAVNTLNLQIGSQDCYNSQLRKNNFNARLEILTTV